MLREVITEAVSSLFSSDVVQVFGFRNPLSNSRFLMIQGDRDEWFLCMYVVCRLKWYFGPSIGTDCFRGLLHALGRRHVCMFGGSLPCEHLLCNDDVLNLTRSLRFFAFCNTRLLQHVRALGSNLSRLQCGEVFHICTSTSFEHRCCFNSLTLAYRVTSIPKFCHGSHCAPSGRQLHAAVLAAKVRVFLGSPATGMEPESS